MGESKPASPTSAEIERHLTDVARKTPELVTIQKVIDSAQGRGIHAAIITDSNTPDDDKQHVLIVAGQHGNEARGRLVALTLIDWLVGSDGHETAQKQKIAIIPNVNPDAAEVNRQALPGQIRPNLDHGPNGPATPEGKAVEMVAEAMQPELFVDVHARSAAGCSYDMVLYPGTRPYTEDGNIHHQIAAEMAAAGEDAGIPHVTHPLTWPGWGGPDPDQPSTTCWAYRKFKSIVMLTESAGHRDWAYPLEMTAAAGLARLKALLAWGNRRHPILYYPGYPCMLTLGTSYSAVVAIGQTAAARRASRIAVWHNALGFKRIGLDLPERLDRKVIHVDYQGEPLPAGAGFHLRAAGKRTVRSVKLSGEPLKPSQTSGYYTFKRAGSTFTVTAITPLAPGQYEITVDFEP